MDGFTKNQNQDEEDPPDTRHQGENDSPLSSLPATESSSRSDDTMQAIKEREKKLKLAPGFAGKSPPNTSSLPPTESSSDTMMQATKEREKKLRLAPASDDPSPARNARTDFAQHAKSINDNKSSSQGDRTTVGDRVPRLGAIPVGGAEEGDAFVAPAITKEKSIIELEAQVVEHDQAEEMVDTLQKQVEDLKRQVQGQQVAVVVDAEDDDEQDGSESEEDSIASIEKGWIACLFNRYILFSVLLLVAGATIAGVLVSQNSNESSEVVIASDMPTLPPTTRTAEPNIPTSQPSTSPTSAPTIQMPFQYFNRIATVPVCLQFDATCNTDSETVAEIISASDDGNILVYTDAKQKSIGFIDITTPATPKMNGLVAVEGTSTSLVIKGKYVVVGVSTTNKNFTNPSGNIAVVDMDSKTIIRTMDLGGQPDSLAISPDKNYIAVAIENERDEDFNKGEIPQLPAGFLQTIDCSMDDPKEWNMIKVELTGLVGVAYPSDPEPEFVDINANNIAVVSLQENNALVLVDLVDAKVVKSFSAGVATVTGVDILEESIIQQNGKVINPREPDGVAWIGTEYFATADEGDLDGGARGFTIFDKEGNIVYENGNALEEWVIRVGHYPDRRSENKGNEPENIHYAEFESWKLIFVCSERSGLVFVYNVADVTNPRLRQVLPAGVSPEGIYAIPSRNLLVVASPEDSRKDKIRSSVSIFELQEKDPVYPSVIAGNDATGNPIPFAALSGLSFKDGFLYSVEDDFYKKSRFFKIDVSSYPYKITKGVRIKDTNAKLSSTLSDLVGSKALNDDLTVNLDLEAIDAVNDGFWVASDGLAGPFEIPSLLLKVNFDGEIQEVVTLPQNLTSIQSRFGLEGLAVDGDNVVVAFKRPWTGEDDVGSRLGIYNIATSTWKFVYYRCEAPSSQNGGWVGLSDLEALGNGRFYGLERDNQSGPDASIKRIYEIDLGDYSLVEFTTVNKTLVRDLIPDLLSTNGMILEKIEGLAVDDDGNIWINNDNDGVHDNSGEQLLKNIGSAS